MSSLNGIIGFERINELPIEIIGNILSCLRLPRDAIRASATCRKWREAFCRNLHTLSFNYWVKDESNEYFAEDYKYYELSTTDLEMLITRTIFQTNGLQDLSISMGAKHEFSASVVILWLYYAGKTLRRLFYKVKTTHNIDVLNICGWKKLEVLKLSRYSFNYGVFSAPNQRFLCLTTLSLSYVSISALSLNALLMLCPKIETLELVQPNIAVSNAENRFKLHCPTLKTVFVKDIGVNEFILEADNIEYVHLKFCELRLFEHIGKGSLKHLKINDVGFEHLDIGEAVANLEILDINKMTVYWSNFSQVISECSKLRYLRLWLIKVKDPDSEMHLAEYVACLPQLSYLGLSFEERFFYLQYNLEGSYQLENVVVIELWWEILPKDLLEIVEQLLSLCPNLRKLIIHGVCSKIESRTRNSIQWQSEWQSLANFTTLLFQVMKRYMNVDVRFEYH